MKPICCTSAVCSLVLLNVGAPASADCPYTEYGWTSAIGAEGFDQARGVAVSQDGTVYTVGAFEEVIDFDPSKRKDKIKAKGRSGQPDIYVTTYTSEGLYRWTARMGASEGDFGLGIAVTPDQDIVLTGDFVNRVDFNPNRGKDKHTARGRSDAFVTLLHPDKSYGWTRTFGGAESSAAGYAIATDPDSNILVAGVFVGTVDFQPGPGVDFHTSNGGFDAFVTKLGPDGSYHWTRTFGAAAMDAASGVAADTEGNVLITCEFRETVDFKPGRGKDMRTSNGEDDAFVVKLSPDGSYLWARTIGGPGRDGEQGGIDVDPDGNLYYTAFFTETVDFDPTQGVDLRVSNGFADLFISSLAPDGSYRWTSTVGGPGLAFGASIDVSDHGRLVTVGNYSLSVDFDPGEAVDERMSNGDRDAFITRYTTDGEYLGTDTFGALDRDSADAVTFDPDDNVLVCGRFRSGGLDFDPTSGVDERSSNGSNDFFITKHYCGQCEFVERHTVLGKRRKIISTVRALAPKGKVTVECTGPGQPVRKSAKISNENTATLKFKNLPQGKYECLITKLKDAAGQSLCNEPTAKRRVKVK